MSNTSSNQLNSSFVHLHWHGSMGSLLDGLSDTKAAVKRAKEMGQPALAITDHGAMYGVIDFYRACKAEGIKPIIGCEVYVAPAHRTRFDKVHEFDRESRHLVLLCKNEEGYRNLCYMVSKAFTEGFYIKPRVDMDLLRSHHEGLIAMSACLGGEIPKRILAGDYAGARNYAVELSQLFGEDSFYLELQDHGIREQQMVNAALLRIHNETGIPLVCTNDCHYIRQSDAEAHDILLCIQTGKTIMDENRMRMEPRNFYMRSTEEMEQLFGNYPDALANTLKIADMCNVEFTFGVYHAPEFDCPPGHTAKTYIRELCEKGFKDRYGNPEEHETEHKQLDFELAMIERMGFLDYFLIVSDFVRYAKSIGVPVGPGRGSAAGSIVSYCLYITEIDPLKYSLYFERFLNPERVSMPDIDMDFGDARRQEVIDYVTRKYGADRVAQIITFGTMKAKAAIRDVGRVLNMPYAEVAAIAKMVPPTINITIAEALEQNPELKKVYNEDPQVRRLIDTARQLEGMPRNSSTHAAGIVITKNPVHTYVPLAVSDGFPVCQFSMVTLEELGLLKLDFLGLRNLTILDDAITHIHKHTPDFSLNQIPEDDAAVFEMLGQGKTGGVFQMESAGMTGVCVNLKPHSIEDLTAIVALYRPGPMDSIPQFVANKHNPDQVKYKHPSLEPILNVTYGIIVYQEQVIEVFRRLAGYSLGQADMVRRAMSKKKVKDIEKERESFLHGDPERNIKGCVANGIPEAVAQTIYDEIYAFANYAFNKAHAVCYAYIAYQTAWFKYHYPKEYMAALLTSVLDSANKVATYIGDCKDMGMELRLPDVNYSEDSFTVDGESIRFGLVAIKSIGRALIQNMVKERNENGLFKDFKDFCERMYNYDINKKAVESLIYAGAFDCFGISRSSLIQVMEPMMDSISRDKKRNLEGQMDLFSMLGGGSSEPDESAQIAYPSIPEYSSEERLRLEREVTGLYLSGHPMQEYRDSVRRVGAAQLGAIAEDYEQEGGPSIFYDERALIVAGIIMEVKKKATKKGSMMAYVTLEDDTGSIELICFSKVLEKYGALLTEGAAVFVKGKVSVRDEKQVQIIPESINRLQKPREGGYYDVGQVPAETENVAPAMPERRPDTIQMNKTLWVRLSSVSDDNFEYLKQLLALHPGNTPVKVYFKDTGKKMGGVSCLLTQDLVNELQNFFGKDNIAIK